jgi:hypothetical protein
LSKAAKSSRVSCVKGVLFGIGLLNCLLRKGREFVEGRPFSEAGGKIEQQSLRALFVLKIAVAASAAQSGTTLNTEK